MNDGQWITLEDMEQRLLNQVTHGFMNMDGSTTAGTGPVPDHALRTYPIEGKPGFFCMENDHMVIPMVHIRRDGDIQLNGVGEE